MVIGNFNVDIEVPEGCEDSLPYICKLVDKYSKNARCDAEDYFSVAFAAVFRAKEKFEELSEEDKLHKKETLGAYIGWAIKNAILKEFQQNVSSLSGCSPYLVKKNEETMRDVIRINNSMISLSATRNEREEFGEHIPFKEIAETSGEYSPNTMCEKAEVKAKMIQIMESELDPNEQEIVYRRVFAGDTFASIAESQKLTGRAVTYRFHKALEKMKEPCEQAGLQTYA